MMSLRRLHELLFRMCHAFDSAIAFELGEWKSDLVRSIVVGWRSGGELADRHGEQGRYTMT